MEASWQSLPMEDLQQKARIVRCNINMEIRKKNIGAREPHPPIEVPMRDFAPSIWRYTNPTTCELAKNS